MPARQITPQSQVDNYLKNSIERKKKAIIKSLTYAGEQCLSEMRSNHGYVDRTGNLTSSMGYVVLENGHPVTQGVFEGTNEGVSKAKKMVTDVTRSYHHGIVLIVVAGMNYAAYVEAKNYNVISSGELLSRKMVPTLLTQLGFSVK